MENLAIRKTYIYRAVRDHVSQCPIGEVAVNLPLDLVDEFAFKIATRMLTDAVIRPLSVPESIRQ
jgi:hypothetical protein